MIVSLGGGQGSEPDRWAYDHGYSGYCWTIPTLETRRPGPALLHGHAAEPAARLDVRRPGRGAGHRRPHRPDQPVPLGEAPDWVDRVYSQDVAEDIANWYGEYSQAGFQGLGSSNANRFQVSGAPVMVYTGTAHPAWRMLLTSYNSDNSVSKIIEMNAATGAMQIYSPQRPMGIENPVYQAFDNGSGVGAALVKANHYQAVNLTLHVIYGHLTWMATYEPESSNPSFVGVGFVDAYEATANNVVFGSSRSAALQNYLTQLSGESHGQRQRPRAGRPGPDRDRQDRADRLGHHRRAEVLVHHPGRRSQPRLRRHGLLGRSLPRAGPAGRRGDDHRA